VMFFIVKGKASTERRTLGNCKEHKVEEKKRTMYRADIVDLIKLSQISVSPLILQALNLRALPACLFHLKVAPKCVSSSKRPITARARVRTITSMHTNMSFEIMSS